MAVRLSSMHEAAWGVPMPAVVIELLLTRCCRVQVSRVPAPAHTVEGRAAEGKHHVDLNRMSPRAQAIW
jgi:hypothetical protein